jgi:hypothetical protein
MNSKINNHYIGKHTALFSLCSVFFITWIFSLAFSYPFYNWDLVAYIASALSYDIQDISLLHKTTYQILEQTIPRENYNLLIATNHYQSHVFHHAIDFYSQLNFYQVKPLYIYIIYVLSKLGIPMVDGTIYISAISVVLSCMLILRWLKKYIPLPLAFSLTIVIAISSRLSDLSRVSSPDALSILITIATIYLILEKKQLKTAMILMLLSIFIRSNNIIFVSLVLCYFIYQNLREKKKQPSVYISLVLAITFYFIISYSAQSYGWWTLFYHSFISYLDNPLYFDMRFSFSVYFDVLRDAAKTLFIGGLYLPSLLLSFVMISFFVLYNNKQLTRYRYYIYIMYLNFIIYFLLWPGIDQWDRIFTPFYILIVIFAVINHVDHKQLSSNSLK